jgi:hypothetical protein
MRSVTSSSSAIVILLVIQLEGWCISVSESDTFSVNTENWQQGESASLRATTGGPGGAGDAFLRVTSDGSGAHGKLVVFNRSQWAGSYSAAGVTSIGMAANNLGATDLRLRLALGTSSDPDTGGTWYSSLNPINLPAGSGWTNIQFPIGANDLTRVQGTGAYSTVMGSVAALRLLHAPTASNRGPNIVATLGVDNIRAVGPSQLFGDYNDDGVVNAADYVVWRNKLNQNITIPNDMTSGSVAPGDYGVWRTHFGERRAGLGQQLAAVPEPAPSVIVAIIGVLMFAFYRTSAKVPARSAVCAYSSPTALERKN